MSASSKIPIPPHPFYPPEINLVGYLANDLNVPTLLSYFALGCAAILGTTHLIVGRVNPRLGSADRGLVLWFVLCGSIHFFFEGYFAFNHTRMAGMQDLFGQLWKEYAHSDSRYLTSDPFVLCMETVTAILWGPLSFLTAYLITIDSPYRHPVQALVSTGQFYGDLLYYATSMFDDYFKGLRYYRPEPYYYWTYYIFMNTFWIVIPGLCVYSSMKATAKAFVGLKVTNMNGVAKKHL